MGYEINMFLGERRREDDAEGKDYFAPVATVDLCKPYGDLYALAQAGAVGDPVYMYASDGNRRLVEDCYGKELIAIPAAHVFGGDEKGNGRE